MGGLIAQNGSLVSMLNLLLVQVLNRELAIQAFSDGVLGKFTRLDKFQLFVCFSLSESYLPSPH